MGYTIGIDIGGTFTDFIVANGRGVILDKVLSTPSDPSAAVVNGLERLAEREGQDLDRYLEQVDRIVHGTTIADNALIQQTGVTTGLLTTAGFRDELVLRRGYKEDIWDPQNPPPPDIVPRRRRLGVVERVAADGEVVTALDEDSVRAAIQRLRLQDVASVAVVLLFSYVNPEHERRLAEIVAEEMPDVEVSLSHEVMPKAPEFERTSTTVLNAYVGPLVTRYLDRIVERVGTRVRLLIMQSSGGAMTRAYMRQRPIQVLASGPAAGVIGCAAAGRAKQHHDLLCVDMGGTSFDVSLVQRGVAPNQPGWNWHHRFVCGLPMISVETLGAGGGSIAHVESGVLHVGPQSAGSEPGPICYASGGSRPTVTDANLVLGLLSERSEFAGGRLSLSTDGVHEAFLEQVAAPMGHSSVQRAASDVRRIVNANMSQAIRRVTAGRGTDPSSLTMLAYGGNGPVHACDLSEELGIDRILVSRQSAAFSALGLLAADPTIDEERSYLTTAPDVERVRALWRELTASAQSHFTTGGYEESALRYSFQLSFRYPGQNWSLTVPVAERDTDTVEWFDADALAAAVDRFHEVHEREHTYARREETPELTGVRTVVSVPVSHPGLGGPERGEPVTARTTVTRHAQFTEAVAEAGVYDGPALTPGATIAGPAIVEEPFTTIVVNPGWIATVDLAGDYVLERQASDEA